MEHIEFTKHISLFITFFLGNMLFSPPIIALILIIIKELRDEKTSSYSLIVYSYVICIMTSPFVCAFIVWNFTR